MISEEIIGKLKAPFPDGVVKTRPGASGIKLLYIDARDVMNRLDEVVGADQWQCRYPHRGCCEIGILSNNEWIWSGETQFEKEKGEASGAFKRAAVLWGIGRYLYGDELETPGTNYQQTTNNNSNPPPPTQQPIQDPSSPPSDFKGDKVKILPPKLFINTKTNQPLETEKAIGLDLGEFNDQGFQQATMIPKSQIQSREEAFWVVVLVW